MGVITRSRPRQQAALELYAGVARRHLPSRRATGTLRPHALKDAHPRAGGVSRTNWPRAGQYTGPGGGTFEQAVPIMIVVLVLTANGDLLLSTSQSAFDIAIFDTGAGFQSKSAVSPKDVA